MALALRDELPQVPTSHQTVGSLLVLDRSHGRQQHVVLFEQPDYEGQAELLTLPHAWQPSGLGQRGLAGVGSPWVPPRVTLEVEAAGGRTTLRGDQPRLPNGVA